MREPVAGVSISRFSAPQIIRKYFEGQKTLMRLKETFSSVGLITRYEPFDCRKGSAFTAAEPGVVGFERGSVFRAWSEDGRGSVPGAMDEDERGSEPSTGEAESIG